ncbi:Holliday junction DNA helicase RuvA [Brachyspira pilosicoli WesB]|uniref:Holliday junction branch migration complex subunit RuvA n=5 Tax=Brachyspira pilosicoli TaxID=52584 RepID=D8IC09_BRAP9|nr:MULTISPECIES: Holliday junction branch migration protein RuvA [Brachyspira]ADK30682.1 holliday junction DNA helicase, RuvA [Brachyspira pilosicoli 95/1000]AGA67494.1 Holliday junction DNA helicase RuvA [Brachyspira pilosicoli P43/6/78]MBW5378689.1 Holliday junction branch migration protein RuvA [Brachyspira pilosicoli]MBW5383605.1 Holliday junction branch migration protein RuvA [Brachyspira pilosicoli]MBW5393093.1 Holliday junction branch migration protein RuvA [Brachyspira pilosicoli]
MFAFIEGKVCTISEGIIALLCSNGVAYEIIVSKKLNVNNDDNIRLYTQLIHKEDSMTLYGFKTREEKKMFNTLMSASGVGAKLAMEVLSTYSIDEIMHILFNKDINMLKKVQGMGVKKAEKLLFEIRDKIEKIDINISSSKISYNENESDVIKALISLGFSNNEAVKALSNIENKENKTTEDLISLALRNLSSI